MKGRKSEPINILDDLRSQDPKKRVQAVMMINEVANAIGPSRTRTQFIGFLNQFADDEEEIVLALLSQLADFVPYLGGQEHEKCLIPLLISFCKLDERVQADKSMELMIPILTRNPGIVLDTIKKVNKPEMVISKDCSAKLIASLVRYVPSSESEMIELYNTIITHQHASIRKVGAKHMKELLWNVKRKEAIGKMLESISSDSDDLSKLLALDALINYYEVGQSLTMSKLKNMLAVQSWRISLKVCELIDLIALKFSRVHFRTIVEPFYIKFLSSSEPELRAASCAGLPALVKNMCEEEIKSKLAPHLLFLAKDEVLFVKIALAENILKICKHVSKEQIQQTLVPIAIKFLKASQLQLTIGVMNQFQILSAYISCQTFQEHVIKKITYHLDSDDWRLKCQAIEMINKVLQNPSFLNQKTINMIVELGSDRIDAVRKKAVELIVEIIRKQPKDWSDANLIPHLTKFKDSKSYLYRQTVLPIIGKTLGKVSDKTLNGVYRPMIAALLKDRVPNIRALALSIIKESPNAVDREIEESLAYLKDEKDIQVKAMMKANAK